MSKIAPAPYYIVMCQVSGGITGFRQGELKKDGKIRTFDSFDEAQKEAQRLNKQMNGPYRTCDFQYWASTREWL